MEPTTVSISTKRPPYEVAVIYTSGKEPGDDFALKAIYSGVPMYWYTKWVKR